MDNKTKIIDILGIHINIDNLKLSEDILIELKNIEKVEQELNRNKYIYNLLKESLKELVYEEYKKQYGFEMSKKEM